MRDTVRNEGLLAAVFRERQLKQAMLSMRLRRIDSHPLAVDYVCGCESWQLRTMACGGSLRVGVERSRSHRAKVERKLVDWSNFSRAQPESKGSFLRQTPLPPPRQEQNSRRKRTGFKRVTGAADGGVKVSKVGFET